jgi:SAM-dependent methyltransferase
MYWCDECSLGRLAGEFVPDEVAKFYSGSYYTHITEWDETPPVVSFSSRLLSHIAWRFDWGVDFDPMEVDCVASGSSKIVCDIGCGNGDQLRRFKALGYEVVGVEPDDDARALAREVGPVYRGTAEQLPHDLDGRAFDVVLMSHVLEHCIDPIRSIENVRRLVAPGGRLIIEVPNNAATGFWRFGPVWPWADVPRHINFFTRRSLERLLENGGFKIEATFYTGYVRQYTADWLNTEQRIWLATKSDAPPNFKANAWWLLGRTALGANDTKYDSIRVHARPHDFSGPLLSVSNG